MRESLCQDSVPQLCSVDVRQQQKAYQSQQKREGQIDVDFVPKKNGNKSENFGGGEYVDYEEVK